MKMLDLVDIIESEVRESENTQLKKRITELLEENEFAYSICDDYADKVIELEEKIERLHNKIEMLNKENNEYIKYNVELETFINEVIKMKVGIIEEDLEEEEDIFKYRS